MSKYTLNISCFSLVLLLLVTVQSGKLPKNWKTCKKGDADMNQCLKGAIQDAIHDLKDGVPSLGVLPLDPFHFEAISIDQGHGPVSIKLDFFDLFITGLKSIIVNDVKTDWKDMELDCEIPGLLSLDGKYKINGQVLVLPINGDGHCTIEFTKFTSVALIKMKETEKNGEPHYEVTSFEFDFNADGVHIQFDNLFNGDKALGDNMNVFLNENWKEILHELKPAISKAFGAAFKEISNRVFLKVPVNELSP